MQATVERIDDSMFYACHGNLLVTLFAGTPCANRFRALGRIAETRFTVHPAGVVFLSLAAGSNPAPNAAARAAMIELSSSFGARQQLSISVIEDSGFFAAPPRLIERSRTEALDRMAGVLVEDDGKPIERAKLEPILRHHHAELRAVSDRAALG